MSLLTPLDALTALQLIIGNTQLSDKHQLLLDEAIIVLDELVQDHLDTTQFTSMPVSKCTTAQAPSQLI